jgi:hypothetical protein
MIIRVIWHRAVATTGAQKRSIASSRHGLEGGAFNAVRASDDGGHFEASRIRATGCPSQVQAWQRSTRRARRVPLHQSCNLPVGRAGYKSSTAVGKWKASSCEPPRQTGRRLPQTAAAYRSTPYQVTGRKARTSRQGKVSSLLGILATFRAARKAAVDLHFTTGRDVGLLSRGSGQLSANVVVPIDRITVLNEVLAQVWCTLRRVDNQD